MKLSAFEGEAAVELLADILEPCVEICTDEKLREFYRKKGTKMHKIAAYILKEHSHAIIEILAAMDGKTVEEYHVNVLTLPKAVVDLLNDEELKDFFIQLLAEERPSSGDATENTGGSAI